MSVLLVGRCLGRGRSRVARPSRLSIASSLVPPRASSDRLRARARRTSTSRTFPRRMNRSSLARPDSYNQLRPTPRLSATSSGQRSASRSMFVLGRALTALLQLALAVVFLPAGVRAVACIALRGREHLAAGEAGAWLPLDATSSVSPLALALGCTRESTRSLRGNVYGGRARGPFVRHIHRDHAHPFPLDALSDEATNLLADRSEAPSRVERFVAHLAQQCSRPPEVTRPEADARHALLAGPSEKGRRLDLQI